MSTLVCLFRFNNGFQQDIKNKLHEVLSLQNENNNECFNLIIKDGSNIINEKKVKIETDTQRGEVYRFFKCYNNEYVVFDNLITNVYNESRKVLNDNPTILVATRLLTYSSLCINVEKTLHIEAINQGNDKYIYWKSLLQEEGTPITKINWQNNNWFYRYLKIW